jgi:hypothetical protein
MRTPPDRLQSAAPSPLSGLPTGRWAAAVDAAAYCARPAHLRRTLAIAAVVGVVLTVANEGDVMLSGAATLGMALKVVANFVTPFIVSNLGLLSGRRRDT